TVLHSYVRFNRKTRAARASTRADKRRLHEPANAVHHHQQSSRVDGPRQYHGDCRMKRVLHGEVLSSFGGRILLWREEPRSVRKAESPVGQKERRCRTKAPPSWNRRGQRRRALPRRRV